MTHAEMVEEVVKLHEWVKHWSQRAEAAETALADAKSRLLDAQAARTIWMERSKANAAEYNVAYDAMCEIGEMLGCAEDWAAIKSALKETLRAQLAEVTWERDRLRVALIECAVPLEVLNAIDCELAPTTQAGITAAVTAIHAALFSAQPEPNPEGRR